MPKQAQARNARGQHVTDSAIVMRGRKALMKASGMTGSARSPLTQQLIETLNHPDSYVTIPLQNGRTKATTIFNLKDKAKRGNVQLHWTVSQDEKIVYAWFTKRAAGAATKPTAVTGPATKAQAKAMKGRKANGGPKRLETPDAIAV